MAAGTYTLLLELDRDATIEVGALGPIDFDSGWYAYTGSAFGPGGFSRVDRHHELAAGERDTRHWHVDYLLGHPDVTLRTDVRTVDADVECVVASQLKTVVPGFGCSDCDCDSHLATASDRETLVAQVTDAHDGVE
ncbi:DUF123 domain-containing protein [Haloarchaeobius sp. HME9146]|uniref:GIY-YIG nuclease family protein n=1 Tax=Haloarchaeobius sp. HME9146 TaxID=2978732 RepID=UPI0021C2316F|nr:GIY-YIG nuclease family protein [Haloarchaeobius sp. HME9146]MCT9097890.1 GIY-YIG nuclease family protein [Haloarchaeobius sp. HME9146]